MLKNIYVEGWNARMGQQGHLSNPYLDDASTEEMALEWLKGYLDAKSLQYVFTYSG